LTSHVALRDAFARTNLEARDRGLVTELVDGTLRMRGRLDYLLGHVLDKPLGALDVPVLALLRLGAYQLTQMRVPAHAAVHETVALARTRVHEGASKLVNAALRRLSDTHETIAFPDPTADPVGYLSAFYSHPAWLVERWLARFGFDETAALLAADNEPSPVTLRVNRRWITREALQQFLAFREVQTEPTAISPWGLRVLSGGNPRALDSFSEGLFSVQGEGSMVMVELLRPGRRRDGWDLCAGVGGKATYLAEWVDDTGSLLATDTSADRLEVLRAELQRLELHSIRVEPGDARTASVEPASMHYALLDAPCSGTGSLRRQPDARWRKTPEGIAELAPLQRDLLEAAARAVKPGGILLYCTCSLEPEENEAVVEAFLAAHPDWQLQATGEKHAGLPENARDPRGYVRLFPHHHGTDGFFAARLVKSADEA
jgi:16S rRNA (cytosine967-C5)-methyltransferase